MTSRRGFLRMASLGAVAVASSAGVRAAAARRPNVLFVITDQQREGMLGCDRRAAVKTPAMDSLAARGMRFQRSYCTYPLCSPSRASLFTSRMPHEVGVNSNRGAVLPEGVPTLGALFAAAGYETAYAGKWHLPAPYPAYAGGPVQRAIPGFAVLPMEGGLLESGDVEKGKGLTYDPRAVEAAVRFLKAPRERPFLLVVSILNPHDICEFPEIAGAHPELARHGEAPPLPANLAPPDREPTAIQESRRAKGAAGYPDDEWQRMAAVYYNLIEAADAQVGRVLDALKAAGHADDTVVLFTSDHGEMLGSHRLVHKQQFYEEAATVPMVVCPAGRREGAIDSTHLVSGVDVAPTLLDYAGIEAPDSLGGRSLRPLVEGRDIPWRTHLVAEVGEGARRAGRMVRSARHKYVVYGSGEDREQLFDLESDPGEMKNLAAAADSAPVLEEHRRLLREWQQATGDEFGTAKAVPTGERARRVRTAP